MVVAACSCLLLLVLDGIVSKGKTVECPESIVWHKVAELCNVLEYGACY